MKNGVRNMTQFILCFILWVFVAPQSSMAIGLAVSPYRLVVTDPQTTGVFTLQNDDDRPMYVQVRSVGWLQVNGEDQYPRTSDIFVNPPMLTIPAHGEQKIRVIRLSKQPIASEESYKIMIDELPPDISVRKPNQVQFISRYVMPVFFVPKTKLSTNVSWSAKRSGNELILTATNSGTGHLKVSNIEIFSGNKVIFSKKELIGYVLKGSSMMFKFKGVSAVPTRIKFNNYEQTVDVNL